ncbi:MAG: cytochrome c oxidase subunit II [Verrucomicrobiota bacterium]
MVWLAESASSVYPVFDPASPFAEAIYSLFLKVLAISAVIFLIVAGLITVAVIRFRDKTGGNGEVPKQDFGSHKQEIFWLVGPVIIVVWLAAISAKLVFTVNAVPQAHPDAGEQPDEEIEVRGHQWFWEVKYPGHGIVSANEVHLPVGKKIRIKLTSEDVIHSFWVPQLTRKMDAIPGRDNYFWIGASKPGVYQGRCTEFCGMVHAWMNFKVYAHDEAEWEEWIAAHTKDPELPTGGLAAAGQKIFETATCIDCHMISGVGGTTMIAPDLTHFSSRGEIGGGVFVNNRENLEKWLSDPQKWKPGCKMPNFKLDPEELQQVVAFLESLK